MLNKCTLLLFLLFSFFCEAQNLYFSFPFQISSPNTGNTRPRVALVNDQPVVVWGDAANSDVLMYSHWNGNGFDAPVQLTHADESVMLGYAEGPVIKTFGDTVYICYVSMGMFENRAYLRKSIDGGQNFSDTILINDRSFGVMLEYANMTLDEIGNPMVLFIRSEVGENPKYVVYRSSDGGNTFTGEINATPDTTMQPCECCPASLEIDNNMVYCTYRNNINNIRDFYVSISENSGMSFDSLRRIDNTDWFSGSCPASGASSLISGDSLISVFMVKESNRSIIKASAIHKTNYGNGPEYFVDPQVLAGSFQMNYPEIAGNGDTIGIVWQDNRSGTYKTYLSYSTTGLHALSQPVLISDFAGVTHQNPHLVYKNGVFHITWRDFNNEIVWYRKASFNSNVLSSPEENGSNFSFYPNPAKDEINFVFSYPQNYQIEILDITGKSVYSDFLNFSKKINTEDFASGVYQILLSNGQEFHSEKLVIQR